SISNLRVDGKRVELGDNCRTAQPVDLELWGEPDEYYPIGSSNGGRLAQYDGWFPGTTAPLNSPYYFDDNGREYGPSTGIDIPPFTGCGNNGDDLDPLVTAMASGPNNPLIVEQGPGIPLDPVGGIDWDDLDRCARPGVCPTVPETPELPDELIP